MILNSFFRICDCYCHFFPRQRGTRWTYSQVLAFLGYRVYRISESMAKDSDGSTQIVWMMFDIRITFENLVP